MNLPEIPIVPELAPVLKPNLSRNPKLNFLDFADAITICPAIRLSEGEDLSKEVVQKRTPKSKTFQIGADSFKVIIGQAIIHYDDKGKMEEVNLLIEDIDGKKVVTKAPYKIEIFTDRVGYHLEKPDGTNFTIELIGIGEAPVNNALLKSITKGCQIFWDGLVENVSMKILLQPAKPEIYTQIADSTAPRVFTWKITQKGQFEFKSFGGDMNKDSLEILVSQKSIGHASFLYTETWTGRVSRKDKKTRIKSWFNDPAYPVVMDPSPYGIITNNDDGCEVYRREVSYHWSSEVCFLGFNGTQDAFYLPGFRFENVGVPSGATITAAGLKINTRSFQGSSNAGDFHPVVYGNKVANADPWENQNSPTQMTKTTQSTSWTPTSYALNSISVKKQVASIVGLPGWASNNAMAFACLTNYTSTNTRGYLLLSDYQNSPSKSALLEISYTGGGNPRLGDMNFMGI